MAPTGKLVTRPTTKLNTESSNQISRHRRQAIIEKKQAKISWGVTPRDLTCLSTKAHDSLLSILGLAQLSFSANRVISSSVSCHRCVRFDMPRQEIGYRDTPSTKSRGAVMSDSKSNFRCLGRGLTLAFDKKPARTLKIMKKGSCSNRTKFEVNS
jgi:hypothetical protein